MNVVIPANYLTPFRIHAIKDLDILSRPIGVNYQYLVITDAHPFGWVGINRHLVLTMANLRG